MKKVFEYVGREDPILFSTKMKSFSILGGKSLVVELPEGATDPFVAKTYIDEDGHVYKTDPQWLEWSGTYPENTVDLPPGNWQIVGMLSEVTEMDAIPLVDKERFIVDGPDLGFRNYTGNKHDWFGTALESLESAILTEGYGFHSEPEPSYSDCEQYENPMRTYEGRLREWNSKQSRVLCRERCLILKRN